MGAWYLLAPLERGKLDWHLESRGPTVPSRMPPPVGWGGRGAVGVVLIGGLLALLGCASLARPNWRHPGTAQSQQMRAHQFDPYPEDVLGPSVEGARPMEFLHPPWDIQRARPHELRRRWFGWQTPPAPAPPLPAG